MSRKKKEHQIRMTRTPSEFLIQVLRLISKSANKVLTVDDLAGAYNIHNFQPDDLTNVFRGSICLDCLGGTPFYRTDFCLIQDFREDNLFHFRPIFQKTSIIIGQNCPYPAPGAHRTDQSKRAGIVRYFVKKLGERDFTEVELTVKTHKAELWAELWYGHPPDWLVGRQWP